MEIPNYDRGVDANTKYKQLYGYMPNTPFRMLMASPSVKRHPCSYTPSSTRLLR